MFETDHVFARFSKDDFKLLEVKFKTPCVKQVQFEHAAEMSILIKGADKLVFADIKSLIIIDISNYNIVILH